MLAFDIPIIVTPSLFGRRDLFGREALLGYARIKLL